MAEKLDFYALSQEDFHVLEEKVSDNPKLLTIKDSVSIFIDFEIKFTSHACLLFNENFRMNDCFYIGQL
jgi:hypothetical protein